MKCRHCHAPLTHVFLDLGVAPLSNALLSAQQLQQPEADYPLKLFVCEQCWLVQTQDFVAAQEIFSENYPYLSSTSQTWLDHAERYEQMIVRRLGLDATSFVLEVGSNDGYLLKHFAAEGIPCLGIEPTDSAAHLAERMGLPVRRAFFGAGLAEQLVQEGYAADLVCGNNVYAHVPDINDFTEGLRRVLKRGGTITLEFPHLLKLIELNQFDTVYHEHFSYLSLTAAAGIFSHFDLRVFDVEELDTHGGSLRIYVCHHEDARQTTDRVQAMLDAEDNQGLKSLAVYSGFQGCADAVSRDFVEFLQEQKLNGKKVCAYGAAAKGNTLLNYSGIKGDLIECVYDAALSKQGKFMPGSHIPIRPPAELAWHRPDWVVILPWNIADEVVDQQRQVYAWGGRFLTAVPELKVL